MKDPGSNIEQVLDLGLVGEPDMIDTRVLRLLIGADIIPSSRPSASAPTASPTTSMPTRWPAPWPGRWRPSAC
jgi:hypothetical protein